MHPIQDVPLGAPFTGEVEVEGSEVPGHHAQQMQGHPRPCETALQKAAEFKLKRLSEFCSFSQERKTSSGDLSLNVKELALCLR